MEKSNQTISQLLSKSYELVKKHWPAFAVVNIMTLLPAFLGVFRPDDTRSRIDFDFSASNNDFALDPLGLSFGIVGFGLIFVVISVILSITALFLHLRVVRDEKYDVMELIKKALDKGLPVFLLIIVMGLMIGIGLILLIVPGIIALHRLILAPYIMVDQGKGVSESIKASNQLAKENSSRVWELVLAVVLVFILGAVVEVIPVFGGLISALVTIAFSLLATRGCRQKLRNLLSQALKI